MAEFVANALQTVAVGSNVLFTDTVLEPCPCVKHREGSGIFTLKGGHTYLVGFSANITGATADVQVDLAIAINGEEVAGTRMASTPSVASGLNNVATFTQICVPCGCCYTISIENVGATALNAQNSNIIIYKED